MENLSTQIVENPVSQVLQNTFQKEIQSLCPECVKIIEATIKEENGKIIMIKQCDEHGWFKDTIASDAKLYLKCQKFVSGNGTGVECPQVISTNNCPEDCGICTAHRGKSCLTQIDITNRCNLTCNACFANANVSGYIYELTLSQIRQILTNIRNTNPSVSSGVQFSGGEPTLHPDFLQAVEMARQEFVFYVQVATNGIKFGNDLDFTIKASEAGLRVAYLQFDSMEDDKYSTIRGNPLVEIKKKAVENCRKAGILVVLVPTITKNINDDQVGKIIQYAVENADIIGGISFQPVSFTGRKMRLSQEELDKYRFTLTDLAHCVEKQTGYAKASEDWYPSNVIAPLADLYSYMWNMKFSGITSHQDCTIGTYFLVNLKDKNIAPVPLTQILNVEDFMSDISNIMINKSENVNFLFKSWTGLKALNLVRKHFNKNATPKKFGLKVFLKSLNTLGHPVDGMEWRLMPVAAMHFQDYYNYNLDRVKSCIIHYAAPDGKLYPFCTYNCGPRHSERIYEEYRKK